MIIIIILLSIIISIIIVFHYYYYYNYYYYHYSFINLIAYFMLISEVQLKSSFAQFISLQYVAI